MATDWKIGDLIAGRYLICHILGGREGHGGISSGMGVVYVVFDPELESVSALKTFQNRFLTSAKARESFRQEALIWTYLENHPYIVRAHSVEAISGRHFIKLEYIAPDMEGRNRLSQYFTFQPLPLKQSLLWAIQFCYGMEHAYARGVVCHQDIKPDNIMITSDGTAKITDFGLARAIEYQKVIEQEDIIKRHLDSKTALSFVQLKDKLICGTPGYIAPEILKGEGADARADIFSFGVVLYQMASGYRESPFLRFWREPHGVEKISRLNSRLWPIVENCLTASPSERYSSFSRLRTDLEALLLEYTGEVFTPLPVNQLSLAGWNNKGLALHDLGHFTEALACFDRALEINPKDASILTCKGRTLSKLGSTEEAMSCLDQALAINPDLAFAWNNKGHQLTQLSRLQEAIICHDRALALNPHSALTWLNKGLAYEKMGQYEDAISSYDAALDIDPKLDKAWNNKGNVFFALRQPKEAIFCCEKALEINPELHLAWNNKGNALWLLGRMEEAIACYDRAIEISPVYVEALVNKGIALIASGQPKEALACYNHALELDPRYAAAWVGKGEILNQTKPEEAISCYNNALEIDQQEPQAWNNKGIAMSVLGRMEEAFACYDRATQINPHFVEAWVNKGRALANSGRPEESLVCYDRAIKLDRYFKGAWFNKGVALSTLDRYGEAFTCFNLVIELDPRDEQAWFNKGAVLVNGFQNYREAIIYFEEAQRLGHLQAAQVIAKLRQMLGK